MVGLIDPGGRSNARGKLPSMFQKDEMRIAFSSVIPECLVKCSRITVLSTGQVTEWRCRAKSCL